jgi:hypothetical protein
MSSMKIGRFKGLLLLREYIKMFPHFLCCVSDWINLEQGVSIKIYRVIVSFMKIGTGKAILYLRALNLHTNFPVLLSDLGEIGN